MAFSFDISLGKFHLGYSQRSSLKTPSTWLWGWGAETESGEKVNTTSALKLAAVYTCLNVLGKDHGSIPYSVRKDVSNSDKYTRKIVVKDNPVHRLIHNRPNPYMTAAEWHGVTERQKKGWGNSFSIIKRDPLFNTPLSIWPTNPGDWTIKKHDGEIFFFHKGQNIPYSDILHFKNFSLDGFIGISTITQNRETLGLAQKLHKYNSRMIGKNPGGYLSAPAPPKDPNQKENLKKLWNEQVSGDEVGGVPLLYGGVEFKSTSISPEDAQYIESTKFTKKQIYGMFDVPMARGQDNEGLTYSNAEQQLLIYVKHCLMPDIVMREQEMNDKLFPESNYTSKEPLYIKGNLAGLLRGDTASQKEFFQAMLTLGVFSPNDVLELLDMSGYEGGERKFIQGAMVPVDLIDQFVLKGSDKATREQLLEQLNTFMKTGAKSYVSDEHQRKLKEKLNGHYTDVADILGIQ